MRYAFLALSAALLIACLPHGEASATGANLTASPAEKTLDACRIWAQAQDDDAVYMWGQQDSGGTVPDIARMRLTLTCLGDPRPEIVGFGSSAGFDEAYCRKHRSAKICRR